MDIQELNWLRSNSHKLDKELRGEVVNLYRSVSKIPCFLQKIYQWYQNKFRKVHVIVKSAPLRGEESRTQLESLLARHSKRIETLELIDGYSARLSVKAIKELAGSSLVSKIYLDREVRALLDVAVPTVKSNQLWNQGYTGKGVTIAVLDTGIYPHPDFLEPVNRIIDFVDLINNKNTKPYDDNGHGTHCAGAAAGNGYASSGKYRGPAFQANLIGIKILNKIGSGKASQVIKGLEWCLNNKEKYNIKIVSLSLGYKATESYREDPVCQAVGKLWQSGIVVCAAAGNDGPETKTINSPGIHQDIITVGASDDLNTPQLFDDKVADFSSRGPTIDGLTKPDVLAPGTNIISAKAKGSFLDKTNKDKNVIDDWYISLSGTSMATPVCAGIIAQLLEAQPYLTPEEVKLRLKSSCSRVTSVDANTQGEGLVNAVKALEPESVTKDLTS
ncbi:MAG: S8 family peptidase [Bacillota bacterium]|uniref:S8 family serine peptidase n=1 Tax=Thermanaerosceptrum fracticalcis TaxID=1712410 RepID=A0A7G6E5D9_THEFR|nr:S8 family peptidase [Thermanaerosceptrum fracticalcis]QNB47293.1 S8 family serine peptidase [Thermanaerosceptrum fracticalcis]